MSPVMVAPLLMLAVLLAFPGRLPVRRADAGAVPVPAQVQNALLAQPVAVHVGHFVKAVMRAP